jgi:hypothetical protein
VKRRRVLLVIATTATLLSLCGLALGAWTGMVDGTATARSQSLTGNQPTGTATGGNVLVSWSASTFSDGVAATSYVVRRYQAVTGTEQTVLAGCAGSVAATSCTENSVPVGSWQYTVTPKYSGWSGAESTKSGVVVVVAADSTAPTTTTSSSPTANAAGWHNANVTVTLTATDSGLGVKQITYSATGAQPIAGNTVLGSSATVPAITTEGTTTLSYFAEDLAGNVETAKTLLIKLDKTAPATATIAALPAKVRNGQSLSGTYADNTGGSGVASVAYYYCLSSVATCDTSSGTSVGSSSTSPYTVTWNSQPADGSYKVVANALDVAGNAKLSNVVTTTVDNTAPTAVDVQATAGASGANTIGSGDVLKLTFSEVMNPATIKAGWDGTSISVSSLVRIANGTTDFLAFATGIELGTVDLGSANWAKTGNGNEYSLNGTMVMTTVNGQSVVTITLSSSDTKAETVTGNTTLTWTPSSTAADAAGNPAATTQVIESGNADVDF